MKKWSCYADTVIKHPKIYTVAITCEDVKKGKRDFPIIDDGGVAIKDGKIIYVGKADEVTPFIGEDTEIIEAAGKTLIPGFCDSHLHITWLGNQLNMANFGGCKKREDMLDIIKSRVKDLAPGEWDEGHSWNELRWEVEEVLTCDELDAVIPDNPALYTRICFHVASANSAALKAAGITKDTPNPGGGIIGRYPNGEPNGILYDDAITLVKNAIPPITMEQIEDGIEQVGKLFNSMGITSVIDANHAHDTLAYQNCYKAGRLTFRTDIMYYLDRAMGDADHQISRLQQMPCITGFGDDMLKMSGAKIWLDGVASAFTACMREPYKDNPATSGSSLWTEDELSKLVCKANEIGWQIGIHTIGDRAEDMALKAFKDAEAISPVQDKRHYLIHYVFPHQDQVAEMKRMNINATVQPTITGTMGERYALTEEQADTYMSPKFVFDNGIICGGSSDAPCTIPDVFESMQYAVTNVDVKGKYWGPNGQITPIEALIMWTKNSAYFSNTDDKVGSIEVGNFADLVILDRDFITGPADEIKDTKVEKTLLGGKVVFEV